MFHLSHLFRRSLVRRVTLSLLLAFGLVYVALFAYLFYEVREREHTAQGLRLVGPALLHSLADTASPNEAHAVMTSAQALFDATQRINEGLERTLLQLWDKQAAAMVFSPPEAGAVLWPQRMPPEAVYEHGGKTYQVLGAESGRWSLRIAQPALRASWLWSELGVTLIPYLLIAFPLILLPIWLAVSEGLRPLRRLSEQITARGAEDLSAVQVGKSYHELTPLVASIDTLLERLRGKIAREHAFVHDAAHELRTPMAVVAAQAHALARAHDDAARDEAARHLEQAVSRGSHLVEQLLQMARIDQEHPLTMNELDVPELTRQVLAQHTPQAQKRGMELSLEAPDTLGWPLDLGMIHTVLHNLVDNAIRYGHDHGRIVLSLDRERDDLWLTVADDGPGIPEAQRHRVFERFHRGVGAAGSGSGLGLSIVKQAVQRLGGTVRLREGLGGRGCSFEVRLPRAVAGAGWGAP